MCPCPRVPAQRPLAVLDILMEGSARYLLGESSNDGERTDTAVVIGKGKRQLTLMDEHIEAVATDIDTDIDGGF